MQKSRYLEETMLPFASSYILTYMMQKFIKWMKVFIQTQEWIINKWSCSSWSDKDMANIHSCHETESKFYNC